MSNPIGLCKLMLCSVFALLPYPHKAGQFQRCLIIIESDIACELFPHKRSSEDLSKRCHSGSIFAAGFLYPLDHDLQSLNAGILLVD